jgi:hypothetical protein
MKHSQLRQIIKEEISKVLNESRQVGNLYHFTYLSSVTKIFENGLRFTPDNTELSRYKNMFSISTTRDYTGNKFFKGNEYETRITLDGNKISEHYSIEPINVENIWVKNSGADLNRQPIKDIFYEERIWSLKEGYLDPKYIIKIDTVVPEDEIKRAIEWGKEDSKRRVSFGDNIFKYVDNGKLNFVKNFNSK